MKTTLFNKNNFLFIEYISPKGKKVSELQFDKIQMWRTPGTPVLDCLCSSIIFQTRNDPIPKKMIICLREVCGVWWMRHSFNLQFFQGLLCNMWLRVIMQWHKSFPVNHAGHITANFLCISSIWMQYLLAVIVSSVGRNSWCINPAWDHQTLSRTFLECKLGFGKYPEDEPRSIYSTGRLPLSYNIHFLLQAIILLKNGLLSLRWRNIEQISYLFSICFSVNKCGTNLFHFFYLANVL